MLAAPKGHPLTKLKKLRLRDFSDAAFIWFPRRESPAYYDRLMHECFRGGLKSPHIVQEAVNETTILSPSTFLVIQSKSPRHTEKRSLSIVGTDHIPPLPRAFCVNV